MVYSLATIEPKDLRVLIFQDHVRKTRHHHQVRNLRRLQGLAEELRLKPQKVPPHLHPLIVNHNAEADEQISSADETIEIKCDDLEELERQITFSSLNEVYRSN